MTARDGLLKAFHILSDDLEASRAGALGKRQAQRLMASGYWDLVSAAIIGLALLAILVFVAQKPLKPVQWILSGTLFLIALAVGIHYFKKVRAAVVEGRVESPAGTVETRSLGKSGWHLYVAGQSFRIAIRPTAVVAAKLVKELAGAMAP